MNDAAFIDVGFQFIQRIDPVAGIIILQQAFNRFMVQVHHRHNPMARLGAGNALAYFLESCRCTDNTRFAAHSCTQLGTHLLISQMDIRFELLYEDLVY